MAYTVSQDASWHSGIMNLYLTVYTALPAGACTAYVLGKLEVSENQGFLQWIPIKD